MGRKLKQKADTVKWVSHQENNPITNPTACVEHSTDTFDTVQLSLACVMLELLLLRLRFQRLLCIEMFSLSSSSPSLSRWQQTHWWGQTDGETEGQREDERERRERREGWGLGGCSPWRRGNNSTLLICRRRHQKTLDLNEFWQTRGTAHQYPLTLLNQLPKNGAEHLLVKPWSCDKGFEAGEGGTNPEECNGGTRGISEWKEAGRMVRLKNETKMQNTVLV